MSVTNLDPGVVLGEWVPPKATGLARMQTTSLVVSVACVDPVVPKEQVVETDTCRVVASVADKLVTLYVPVFLHPHQSMRVELPPALPANPNCAVALVGLCASPLVALTFQATAPPCTC